MRFYHPSNAKFWFYGDDPADDRLELLETWCLQVVGLKEYSLNPTICRAEGVLPGPE